MTEYYERAPSGEKGRNVFCTESHRRAVSDDAYQGRKYHKRLNYAEATTSKEIKYHILQCQIWQVTYT